MREHYSAYKVLKMDTRFAVVAALLCCLTVEGQPVPSLLDNTTLPVIYPGKILDGEEQVCPVQEVIRDEVIESVRAILRNLSELIPQVPTVPTTTDSSTTTPTTEGTPTTPTTENTTCLGSGIDEDARVVFEVNLTTGAYQIATNSGIAWTTFPGTGGSNCNLQGVLKITFPQPIGGVQRQFLQFELYLASDATDWDFNIGDSTNNGYGGDQGHTSNAAEVHNRVRDWYVFSNTLPGYQQLLVDHLQNVITEHVTVTIGDEHVEFDNHNGTHVCYDSKYLFTLSGQTPTYGQVNYDIFFGMNRVITSTSRSGTGLCRAVIKALNTMPING